MTFAYHTLTHDYYQLPLILVVAVSLPAVMDAVLKRLAAVERSLWVRWFVVALLFGGAFFKAWDVHVNLARKDYRGDAVFWQEIGAQIEPGARVLAMTQDYGLPLAYYGWLPNEPWLTAGDLNLRALAGEDEAAVLQRAFASIGEYDYFVITQPGLFSENVELKNYLYENYSIVVEGDDYLIFDLK